MNRPISDYALLSDCHRAALVSRDGSIDWLCAPRFDSPAVFGCLLDAEAGRWRIAPEGQYVVSRRYADGSLVLRTCFTDDQGVVVLTDALATGPNEHGHELGTEAPGALLRRVACTRGRMRVASEFAPRPEYGLVHPVLELCDGGLRSRGGPLALALSSPGPLEVDGSSARATFSLEEGDVLHFALHFRPSWDSPPVVWPSDAIEAGLQEPRGVDELGRHPSELPRAVGGIGSPQWPCATGSHVLPHGCHHRGAHDVAAGSRRRRAQLGLPVRVDP